MVMAIYIPFDNSYASLPPRFYTRQVAQPVSAPRLLVFNDDLARDLGISGGDPADLAAVFGGNRLPDGAAPLAQVYAGHQFGGFSPQLGDGRALLLGEVVDSHGQRRDIQLKGSGQTPYSRMGDGRAWLGPVLREYLLSEAMFALGVPTTRALAAVASGDTVYRETSLPGAVLTRVASSHIRVGTFEYFAAKRDLDGLQALFDYTRARHYPQAEDPAQMLEQVIAAQVRLVVSWLALGFIHGVMNTDNTALSGETIDYGPAAFLDSYHPVTVYSAIDRQGRYAFDNQAQVIVWNMAQLATALVPLMPDTDAAIARFTQAVHDMPAMIAAARLQAFGAKLGLAQAQPQDSALVDDLLALMQVDQADFTNTFRALAQGDAGGQFRDGAAYAAWHKRWQARIADEDGAPARMLAANPAYIPRNHRVEQMIAAAVAGDMAPFTRMLRVLSDPYTTQDGADDLAQPPLAHEVVQNTFCGT